MIFVNISDMFLVFCLSGLDSLHLMTSARKHELRVDLETFDGNRTFATYSGFTISDRTSAYILHYDHFSGGNAGTIEPTC